MKELTPRQAELLEICKIKVDAGHRFPTIAKLMELTGDKSSNGIRTKLEHIVKKGFIERDGETWRIKGPAPGDLKKRIEQLEDTIGNLLLWNKLTNNVIDKAWMDAKETVKNREQW